MSLALVFVRQATFGRSVLQWKVQLSFLRRAGHSAVEGERVWSWFDFYHPSTCSVVARVTVARFD